MGQLQYAIGTVIGIVALVTTKRYLDGADIWMINSDRSAFAVLFSLALVMCSFGIQMTVATGDFTVRPFIVGGLIGLPVLIAGITVLAGKTLPVIGTARNAIIVLWIVMVVKWGISTIHLIGRLLQVKA